MVFDSLFYIFGFSIYICWIVNDWSIYYNVIGIKLKKKYIIKYFKIGWYFYKLDRNFVF